MKLFLVLITLTCATHSLIACSCGPQAKLRKNDVKHADLIFVGTIINNMLDTTLHKRIILFEVSEGLKGTTKGERITIMTNPSSAGCGITVTNGESWYIYSFPPFPFDAPREVDICGRNKRLTLPRMIDFPPNRSEQIRKQHQLDLKQVKRDKRVIRRAVS